MIRVGVGFDVHRLTEGRPLILGGVSIPFPKGLLGHSDADVLTHAVCDALLGAAGLGDIGMHFPDSNDAYKGIDSLELLARVNKLIRDKHFLPISIDSVVIAQNPKLNPYRSHMRKKLAEVLGIPEENVNVKASTTEGLGFIGKGEGIAAQAAATIKIDSDERIEAV